MAVCEVDSRVADMAKLQAVQQNAYQQGIKLIL
jgi:hypothetical protein